MLLLLHKTAMYRRKQHNVNALRLHAFPHVFSDKAFSKTKQRHCRASTEINVQVKHRFLFHGITLRNIMSYEEWNVSSK